MNAADLVRRLKTEKVAEEHALVEKEEEKERLRKKEHLTIVTSVLELLRSSGVISSLDSLCREFNLMWGMGENERVAKPRLRIMIFQDEVYKLWHAYEYSVDPDSLKIDLSTCRVFDSQRREVVRLEDEKLRITLSLCWGDHISKTVQTFGYDDRPDGSYDVYSWNEINVRISRVGTQMEWPVEVERHTDYSDDYFPRRIAFEKKLKIDEGLEDIGPLNMAIAQAYIAKDY